MAGRHRRGLVALAATLVVTGAAVAVAERPHARWSEPAPTAPRATSVARAVASSEPEPVVTRSRAIGDAQAQIRRNSSVIRSAPGEQYRAVDTVVEPDGTRHVRFQRTHRGLPVLGGDFVVHSTAHGRFTGATVAQRQPIDVPRTTKVERKRAIAVGERRFTGRRTASSARQVIDAFAGTPVPAWEVTVAGQASRLTVVVDATTGEVRRAYDEVHTAEAGTGHGLQVGDVPLGTTRRADGTYALVDADRGGNTVRDALNEYIFRNPKKFAEFSDADDVWGDGTRADRATAAVDVQYGMARTWDYLRDTFGRSGIRNDGKGVPAYVHEDVDSANAAWSSSCHCMWFGDGAASGKPFTALDLVAHEMAHGLTDATAHLVNSGESGGLNEATSDIFGTLVEFAAHNPADPPDYLIGEKTETRAPALRRMDEPSRDGKSASCWTPEVKNLDEHYSSGIGNKFFYTLAVGSGASEWGDSPPCGGAAPVTGIGNDRAARIWYRALNVYMVSNTNYSGARDATLRAATDLYGAGSVETRTVAAAWLAAGVDGSDPSPGAPQIAPFADSTPAPHVGESVRIQVTAREPQGQAVTFSATKLPPGVAIDPAGLITGAPTVRGEYQSTVIATDPDGNTDRELLYWLVKGPPVVQSASPAQTMQLGAGARGSYDVTFADAPDYLKDPADSFKVTATGVPDGLTMTVRRTASGTYVASFAGVPTTAGSGTTVVTATDADGEQVTASVPWQVLPARAPGPPVDVTVTGGDGTALVQWNKPTSALGYALVTGYVVRVAPGTGTTLPVTALSLPLTGLDTRRAYTIGVRATSAIGDGAEKTVTLSPTALPITVSPAAVTHGAPVTLSGKVLRGGSAVAGAVATLQQRPAGKTTWSSVATVKTDTGGAWRYTVKPVTTTAYRVTYPGSAGMWAATSATSSATVRYAVTVRASTTRPKADQKITITGTAKPARAGSVVTLQRLSGTRWVTVTSVKTTASGAFSFSRAFKRGSWTLRVAVAGNAYNAGGTSASVKLKVQ